MGKKTSKVVTLIFAQTLKYAKASYRCCKEKIEKGCMVVHFQ